MTEKNLIIDTDCGIDDALAIMAALLCPHCKMIAITAVAGNTSVDNAGNNVGVLLGLTGHRNVPIYRGAEHALATATPASTWEGHGKDGLGDCGIDRSQTVQMQNTKSAPQALVDIVNEKPNEISVLAIGPLTNIAIACVLDNLWATKVKELYVMGGSHLLRGNTTPTAEFNFFADPEAAKCVFESFSQHNRVVTMVSWEMTLACGIPWSVYDQLEAIASKTEFSNDLPFKEKAAIFFAKTSGKYKELSHHLRPPNDDGSKGDSLEIFQKNSFREWTMCDSVASAALLEPSLVLRASEHFCYIETEGRQKGSSIIDWNDLLGKQPNCRIIEAMDKVKFVELIKCVVTEGVYKFLK